MSSHCVSYIQLLCHSHMGAWVRLCSSCETRPLLRRQQPRPADAQVALLTASLALSLSLYSRFSWIVPSPGRPALPVLRRHTSPSSPSPLSLSDTVSACFFGTVKPHTRCGQAWGWGAASQALFPAAPTCARRGSPGHHSRES